MGVVADSYELTLTDRNDCVVKKTFNVPQPDSPIKTTITKKDVNCFNGNDGEIKLLVSGGSPGYNYQWSGGQAKDELKKAEDLRDTYQAQRDDYKAQVENLEDDVDDLCDHINNEHDVCD